MCQIQLCDLNIGCNTYNHKTSNLLMNILTISYEITVENNNCKRKSYKC